MRGDPRFGVTVRKTKPGHRRPTVAASRARGLRRRLANEGWAGYAYGGLRRPRRCSEPQSSRWLPLLLWRRAATPVLTARTLRARSLLR